ncbi:MAG: hypothetical protein G01um101430_454 [Parcubacteria group bacterium Gr01-1014_30]|nr:MAG: hypothetical protein G01um101430_454 [Parcubacteria group bacterium Gr01-1014_30]
MTIWEAKAIERKNFREAARLHSHLFGIKNTLDSPDFLKKYGIFIPSDKPLPQGYLKLWPQDFIVEEITPDGEWTNVFPDKFMHKKRDYLPEDPVLYATLVKCGLSTIEAVGELAQKLRIKPEDVETKIKLAGIKDKHAITSQLISLKGVDIEKLYDASSEYFFIKNVFSSKRELFLGGLRANQFTILVRTSANFKKDEFLARLAKVQKSGFYNYYYLQRFGIPRLTNALSGLLILKGDYESAVKAAFCFPGERESLYFSQMRKDIEKLWGNWEEIAQIIEFFPATFQDELQMTGYLVEHPNDFVGALNQIPRVTQLWLTSFTALLFNQMLSFHLKEGKVPPKTIPLVLEKDPKTWRLYEKFLKPLELFSQTFVLKNVEPFPFINPRKREQKTVEHAQVLNYTIVPEGAVINFVLPKGCYATTFLSHMFTLASGTMPPKFSGIPIDTKASLKLPSLEEVLNKFIDVVKEPSWRFLWRIY